MDIWGLLLKLIETGVAFWLFTIVYAHVDKLPIAGSPAGTPPSILKWAILCIPVIIIVLVIAAIWGLGLPAGVH